MTQFFAKFVCFFSDGPQHCGPADDRRRPDGRLRAAVADLAAERGLPGRDGGGGRGSSRNPQQEQAAAGVAGGQRVEWRQLAGL